MKEAGNVRIQTSILQRQKSVAQFFATRPVLDLCEKAIRRPGAQGNRRLWEQTGIDWKGAQKRLETEAAAEPGNKVFTDSE